MRLLLLIFFAVSSPVLAQEANPLVGTWKLIASESIVENEAPSHTFGLHPKGYLIITQEGRLMIMMTADNRKAGMVMLNGLRCTRQWRRSVGRFVSKARTSSSTSTFL